MVTAQGGRFLGGDRSGGRVAGRAARRRGGGAAELAWRAAADGGCSAVGDAVASSVSAASSGSSPSSGSSLSLTCPQQTMGSPLKLLLLAAVLLTACATIVRAGEQGQYGAHRAGEQGQYGAQRART